MVDYTLALIDESNVTVGAGTFSISNPSLSTLTVSDNDLVSEDFFDGDASFEDGVFDDPEWDDTPTITQEVAGTDRDVYLETGYVIEDSGGTQYTVYLVETVGPFDFGVDAGTALGYVFPDGQQPPPGNYTIVSTFNPGNGLADPDDQRIRYDTLEQDIPCFTRGTQIQTSRGPVLIEDLQVGDMIRTLDNGCQPLRWIGSVTVPATGDLAPILIKAGALSNSRDLKVSPKHRMLLTGWRLSALFDQSEVLVTADSLLNDNSIIRQEGGTVEYFHLLFDRHEIVFAEGAPSESFHPVQEGIGKLAEATRAEILRLFPELAQSSNTYGPAVRSTLQAYEAAALLPQ